jgi:xylan 1,4-beta-xylosidase
MTKHHGKYYLQYAAPGTEFSGYADGVIVSSEGPLGNFSYFQSDPLSFKPGGFARGAGHGSTFHDNRDQYWHVSTITIAVKNNFERRIGIWPAGFDSDDIMYCNTAFGDYPHWLPDSDSMKILHGMVSRFTGWMLLNYNKPVVVSSTLGGYHANNAVDEDIKTYWSASTGKKGEWIQSDLGKISTIHAIQLNYADQGTNFLGKQEGIFHQYIAWFSADGKNWKVLADKSHNKTDVPHDYIELEKPVHARYIKIENIHMPGGCFAISGLRVFGRGSGTLPDPVKEFMVLRTEKDKRSAWIRWSPVDNAWAYNIYFGPSPDKLYNCIMVHNANEYWFKGMDKDKRYYFTIQAINENGVSAEGEITEAE